MTIPRSLPSGVHGLRSQMGREVTPAISGWGTHWAGMGYPPQGRTANRVLDTPRSEYPLRFPEEGLSCFVSVFVI